MFDRCTWRIGLTGFFTTLLIACFVRNFRNEIADIQKEINPTEKKIEELQTEKNEIESDLKNVEDVVGKPKMSKGENEYGNE